MNLIPNRETAYVALFNRLSGIAMLKSCTRRLKHWQDVAAEDQPALYMGHTGESTSIVRGQPARIVLEVNLWVYARSEGNPVGPVINPVLDAIEAALQACLGMSPEALRAARADKFMAIGRKI
jgi:hypothetical protein